MIRTQVYLPKSVYHSIELVARRDQKPKAQVIRELLEQGLEEYQGPQPLGNGLLKLAALGKKLKVYGPADLSASIDKHLYEDA